MDRREAILARLLDVLSGVDGVATACRNRELTDDDEMPVAQLLDADEEADDDDPKARPGAATRRVVMTPEIYLTMGDVTADLGTSINLLRARAIKAVLSDASLKDIVGTNGAIRYRGCATGLSRGRQMLAEMGLSFAFHYPLIPGEL